MAIHTNDIQLSEEHKQRLAEVAEKNGQPWQDLIDAALAHLEHAATSSEPDGTSKSEQEREQAFLEAAGGWADMDVDTWLEEIYDQRLRSSRPAPKL